MTLGLGVGNGLSCMAGTRFGTRFGQWASTDPRRFTDAWQCTTASGTTGLRRVSSLPDETPAMLRYSFNRET